MKSAIAALLVLCAIVLTGCSSVTVRQPLGEKLPAAELKQLEGSWLHPDGAVMEVHALTDGQLAYAVTAWDEKEQQFKMESGRMAVTRAGALTFVAIPNEAGDRYMLALCKLEGNNTASIYYPASDVFAKAVVDRHLEGSLKQREQDKTVNIDAPPEKVLEFINRLGVENCFVDTGKNGLVYRRVEKREQSGAN